jgi:hypothetical protein
MAERSKTHHEALNAGIQLVEAGDDIIHGGVSCGEFVGTHDPRPSMASLAEGTSSIRLATPARAIERNPWPIPHAP